MNITIKKIISILLVLIWLIIIFNFSNMDTNESNTKSKEVINKVVETTQIGKKEDQKTKENQEQLVNYLNKPLRKVMHLTIYLILALLLINTLTLNNVKHKYLITIIICIIYALTDEYHQTLIKGRTGQLTDVIIDTLGSTTGIIINKLYKKNFTHKK